MTRARVRRAFVASSDHGRRYMDFFCLTPIGIRVAYAVPRGCFGSSPPLRAGGCVAGRVMALTANPHYALQGVRPGARLATRPTGSILGRGVPRSG